MLFYVFFIYVLFYDSIVLSSFELKAILLISSVATLSLSLLNLQGHNKRGAKGAKAIFQISAKRCVFIAALK